MTLQEFRSRPDLVEYANSIFSQKKFKLLVEALNDSHPKNFRSTRAGLPESDHALLLGRIFGYDECINTLLSAATMTPIIDQTLTPTFAPIAEDGAESE